MNPSVAPLAQVPPPASAPAYAEGISTARRRFALLVLAGLAVALGSLLAPSVPDADPWGWAIWGRQIDHGTLITVGYPSWKPLPAVVTALAGLAGWGAPGWLVVVRGAGLAVLALGWRLAARASGPGNGLVAGAIAVLALALLPDHLRFLAHGTSEPLLVALLLGAVEAHGCRRRRLAFGLIVAAGLLRPEAWPFAGAYALVALRPRTAVGSIAAAMTLAALLAAWLVPDWLGSGDALHGSVLARVSGEAVAIRASKHPALDVLTRGASLVLAPVGIGALAAIALAWPRRAWLALCLAALALVWVVIVVGMTALGYAGVARFLYPAAAVACVLGGVGASWLLAATPTGLTRLGLGVALAALLCPFVVGRVGAVRADAREAGALADAQQALQRTVTKLGGPNLILRCGRPSTNPGLHTALAWQLGVATDAIVSVRRASVVLDVAGQPFPDFAPPGSPRGARPRQLLAAPGVTVWTLAAPRRPSSRVAACLRRRPATNSTGRR